MQVVLNKQEKEKLVIRLYKEGKTIRQIASEARISFTDIGKIIRKINGDGNDDISSTEMRGKSKATQAMNLFLHGKRPVEVAIELDLSANEIEEMQQEFWVLTKLDELALVYMEIRNYLDLFLNLFHVMKINKMINERDIETVLKYAVDLSSLDSKLRSLANTVLDLEIKKKELSTQLIDLAQVINQYQGVIDNKKQGIHRTR